MNKAVERGRVFTLIDGTTFNDTTTSEDSADTVEVNCYYNQEFVLIIQLTRAEVGAPAMLIDMQVEFSWDEGATWIPYTCKAPFGSLKESAGDPDSIGAGKSFCVLGRCAGPLFNLAVTATTTDADDTITLTAKLQLL